MLKRILFRILEKEFFAITVAVGAAVLGMVALVQTYDYFWGETIEQGEVDNPVERALVGGDPEGPIETLNIRGIPAPFVGQNGEASVGVIFLDVEMDLAGEGNFDLAKDQVEVLGQRFADALRNTGFGSEELPGEIDGQRLAQTFLVIARDELSLRGITAVRVADATPGD